MRYIALATDYDGTLADHGAVDAPTLTQLAHLRESGRRLIMVTGRELDDLLRVFPHANLFDLIVAENGALLYNPATQTARPLSDPPPPTFVQALQDRGVAPLSVGQVIVATWEPHETTVLQVIRDLGLELQVIFNKGAVMVLPSGMNKAAGLKAALEELKLSPHNVVGIGDAENDHAFLSLCECAVAVANALPILKEQADWVTEGARGAGVSQLIEQLLADDLASLAPRLNRYQLLLGTRDDRSEVKLDPYGCNVLVAGTSGSGKSTLTTGLLERMAAQNYQYCIIDPEGDYEAMPNAVVLGSNKREVQVNEVMELLNQPGQNLVVNLLGIKLEDRPAFLEQLLPRLREQRASTGRPHWLIIDEAHHMLPAATDSQSANLLQTMKNVLFITVHPDHMAHAALTSVDILLTIGETPAEMVRFFSEAIGQPAPDTPSASLETGEALFWSRHATLAPFRFRSAPPEAEHRRHKRKYAEGELSQERSFYFRGPEGALNLRAQNLILFMQLAEGVDDATWQYHLGNGDYSNWFRSVLRDNELADEAAQIEQQPNLAPNESRARIRQAIEARYTQPA
jgi:hydroxymethylpyrimidine pyrophosphatase-like HAD family hydrolase/GTPase SAR1 family protein